MRTHASIGRRHLTPAAIQLYRVCDDASGVLLSAMVVFAPWAFGTTQAWAMWVMNIASYALGSLLLTKLFLRWRTGYTPPRWDCTGAGTPGPEQSDDGQGETTADARRSRRFFAPRVCTRALLVLTLLLIAYCFTSAINARASFNPEAFGFEYREAIRWLPYSLDAARTWFWSWNYLALAFVFWAARDWLLGKTEREVRTGALHGHETDSVFPARIRTLLWVLAINGGLLAIEGIVQRLEGSGHLLFLVKPRVNPGAEAQFGPYAYRGSAASYFNLLWPVCLGFWWTLHRYAGSGRGKHSLLLVCTALMAACPFVSTSRGGALVAAALLFAGALYLALSQLVMPGPDRHSKGRVKSALMVIAFCVAAVGLGYMIGWRALKPRMAELREGLEQREEMFENARPMARDYPVFGTGPGTFEMVFQLYRKTTDTYWPAQLHNDWLETRITFGWVGFSLVLAALALVLLRWFARGGIYGGRRFVGMTWLALAGCLAHALYDFPFQIYSILFLFILLCAMLFTLSRRPFPR